MEDLSLFIAAARIARFYYTSRATAFKCSFGLGPQSLHLFCARKERAVESGNARPCDEERERGREAEEGLAGCVCDVSSLACLHLLVTGKGRAAEYLTTCITTVSVLTVINHSHVCLSIVAAVLCC